MIRQAIFICLSLLIYSCSQKGERFIDASKESLLKHANNVQIWKFPNFHLIELGNKKTDFSKYVFYSGEIPDSIRTNSSYIKIKTPVQRVVSNSTTHLSMLDALQGLDCLKGFAQTQFISAPAIIDRVKNGQIKEVGHNSELNIEEILAVRPQLVLTSGLVNNSPAINQLNAMGIPVLSVMDYSENSVLGKAEWIKLFGLMLNKEGESIKLFNNKKKIYDSLIGLMELTEIRPTVMSGTIYGGSWFMPGGKNYNSSLINQAGGKYIYEDDESNGWLNLDFEEIYTKAYDSDLWIGAANFSSLDEMIEIEPRYANFKAFENNQVYTYTARVNENGANDYFESGNINPEKVLADHIKILHPELLPDYDLYYYVRLE